MNKIITIVKKELKRYFTDKRTLISLFLPGILIFIIYSIMGNVTSSMINGDTSHLYSVHAENLPDNYKNMYDDLGLKIKFVESDKTGDEAKAEIENGTYDIYLVFDENFTDKVNNNETPNVSIYYNSKNTNSEVLYELTASILNDDAINVTYNFMINGDPNVRYNLASDEDMSRKFIQMMMPFLLIIFLFSGCMAISTEAIAGEKERGTIYTLLVTPTKRSEIAIGKILALSIVSLVSATVSFIGTILSLPKLMGGDASLSLAIYGVADYLSIFAIILTTVIFFTSLLLLVSSFARSVKEAGQLALVVMIPTMLFGVTSMLGTIDGIAPSFIPIYNSITSMSMIFAGDSYALNLLVTILANVAYIGLIVFLLTKMFNSEKIMKSA
ncbi:MAG: ABC transporter permease [Bacilli bacterium]|nr:ABC transporter permease [Bacilli bacterium]